MLKKRLMNKIRKNEAKIAVIGLGYVGLPTAAVLANAGFEVAGIDTNPKILNMISQAQSHTKEPGLEDMISKALHQGNLRATNNDLKTLSSADVVVVCVQTPVKTNAKPDLTYLKRACEAIARTLNGGKLIIIQSTLPPGATRSFLVPLLEKRSELKCGVDFWLAYCPERMAPGNGLKDLMENERLIGGYDAYSARLAAELFRFVTKGELQVTSLNNAEAAKVAENTFRYVNIGFANELALICKEMGADVMEVIRLANTHPRVNIHIPGCGVGGPCLSKDACFLLNSAGAEGREANRARHGIIAAARRLNNYIPRYTAQLVEDSLKKTGKNIGSCRIAVLGTAYKGEVSDARNSPAEQIIHELISLKSSVVAYDPYCSERFGAEDATSLLEAVSGTDCILIATDHRAFREIDLPKIKSLMNEKPIFVDGRRMMNPKEVEKQGFKYIAIGYNP